MGKPTMAARSDADNHCVLWSICGASYNLQRPSSYIDRSGQPSRYQAADKPK